MTRLKKSYSSREVAALTGLTAKQLQVWQATGLVTSLVPSHRTEAGGFTERRYSPVDLLELLVLAALLNRGFTVQKLHRLVTTLRQRFGVRLFEATSDSGPVRLLTDGREIYGKTAAGEFFNILRDPSQPLLVIGEEGSLKELSSKIRTRRKAARLKTPNHEGTKHTKT